jgi:hypothetical protein
MIVRRPRHLLVMVIFFTILSSPLALPAPARTAAQGGDISAAAFVMGQGGLIGSYGLPEPPGWNPVTCIHFGTGGGQTVMSFPGLITVAARPGQAPQIVHVSFRVYQRLANGSFTFVQGGPTVAPTVTSSSLPTLVNFKTQFVPQLGPDYVFAAYIEWLAADDVTVEGWVLTGFSWYQPTIEGSSQTFPTSSVCGSLWGPFTTVNATNGTVNSTLNYTVHRYPVHVTVNTRWDGTVIDSVVTGNNAAGSGNFKIPAAPIGPHLLQFKYGKWVSSVVFTIKPRIKIIPSGVARDQTVNVSLRGFAKQEVVKIRWKKGPSWVQIAQVTTSNTGSANINVKVPKFVPDGATSVRGDGPVAAAQTNAVTVSGGPFNPATAATPTLTPTRTPTKTPTATATSTQMPSTATATISTPAQTSTLPPTESATVTPSIEATSVVEAVTPEASETPTSEPTATLAETAVTLSEP